MYRPRPSMNAYLGRAASAVVLLVTLVATGLAATGIKPAKQARAQKSVWVQLVPAPGWQKGSPLQVAAIVPQDENLLGYLSVINRSYEPVRGFSLAVVGTDLNTGKSLGVYRILEFADEVPARGMQSLTPQAGTLFEAARFAHERGASSAGFTVAVARALAFTSTLDAKRLDTPEETDLLDDPFDELEPQIQAGIESYLAERVGAPATTGSENTTNIATPGGFEPTASVHCVTPNPNEPAGSGNCSVSITTTGGGSTPTCAITQCPRWPKPCNRQVCGNAVIITV